MLRLRRGVVVLAVVCCSGNLCGQMQGEKIAVDEALDRALKSSSLTYEGKPFHAVMEIGPGGTEYTGRVEVWWMDVAKYKVMIASPKFSQERVVNGATVFEKNEGDYYPRWLENLVDGILDPIPVAKNFRGGSGAVMVGAELTNSCIRRDDKLGGITNELTWGIVCFGGAEPHVSSVQTTNLSIRYKDWVGFGKKKIAREYETSVLSYQPVLGRLSVLEELKKPDETLFAVSAVTPVEARIATSFVSTLQEESLLEMAPVIEWPSVREGKTEGYMIVYARTDRTGQVREISKHNSDQPGLEQFGMEQALRYKFKPLMVDGVAQQMEMPLVLHFVSRLDDPLPMLTLTQMKKQIYSCQEVSRPAGSRTVIVKASVNEEGKLTGEGSVPNMAGTSPKTAIESLRGCRFSPYLVKGKATYYHGYVEVWAR